MDSTKSNDFFLEDLSSIKRKALTKFRLPKKQDPSSKKNDFH